MSELCSKEVKEWVPHINIVREVTKGRSIKSALWAEVLMGAIFTSIWWPISLLYHVGRPTCDQLFASTRRDELEAKPMSWKLEAFLWIIARLTLDCLEAQMDGRHFLGYLDFLLETLRRIFAFFAFTLQSRLYSIHFFCAKHIAQPWNTLGGYKTLVPKTKACYTYQMLEDRHIRLLRLHRDWLFRIQYELVKASLDDPPHFEAISYTWGNQLEVEDIIISDRIFSTTRTVASILRSRCHRLRLFPVPGMELFMWIDALCINQDDKDEKNHQVPLMREIYSCAIRVVVCLGNGSYDREAVWLLFELLYISPALSPEQALDYLQERYPSTWIALSELLRHPWFTRIWIVQEVAVARDILLIYGNGMLSWDVVHWIMRLYMSRPRSTLKSIPGCPTFSPTPDLSSRGIIPNVVKTSVINDARSLIYIKRNWNLSEVMMSFVNYKATDPRDKVFALLGLVTDDLDIKEWIDYYETPEKVYTKTARYILSRNEDGLALLALAGIGLAQRSKKLPTWVPDWSDWSEPHQGLALDKFSVRYNASGGRKCNEKILLDLDLDAIRLVGMKVDTVKVTVKSHMYEKPSLDNKTCSHQRLYCWFRECRNLEENYSFDPYVNLQPRKEAFWRALIGDRTTSSRPAPMSFASNFRAVEEFLLSFSLYKKSHTIPSISCDSCLLQPNLPAWKLRFPQNLFLDFPSDANHHPDFPTDHDSLSKIFDFFEALTPISAGRRFCVTDRGYMGWVPPYTVSGDLVCIFHGARTPFLLRTETSDKGNHVYKLVGECFFHGMMDGEIFTSEYKMEDFIVY